MSAMLNMVWSSIQSEGMGWCWENLLDENLKHILTRLDSYSICWEAMAATCQEHCVQSKDNEQMQKYSSCLLNSKVLSRLLQEQWGKRSLLRDKPWHVGSVFWVEASSNVLGSGRGGWIHLCLVSSAIPCHCFSQSLGTLWAIPRNIVKQSFGQYLSIISPEQMLFGWWLCGE